MKTGPDTFIDTHCHLDVPVLYGRLTAVIAAAGSCGVKGFIVPGVEPQNWGRIISLARDDGRIFAAPGVHPQNADKWNHAVGDELKKMTPAIIAIGEIGLDYSEGMPHRELQQEVFRAQLRIAGSASLPVIIHCRRAFADTLRIMAEEQIQEYGGVMHAFSGSLEIARICVSMGLRIGIAGPVTWNNAVRPVKVVEEIDLEHLLLETDSPDISPEPHRDKGNQPAFLLDIARKVAAIKGKEMDYVARATTANAKQTFPGLLLREN